MRTPDTHDFEGFEQRLSSLMLQASDTVHVPSDVTSRSIRLARVHRRRQRVLTIVSTLVTVVVTCGAVLLPHALRNTHPGPPAHPTTGVVTNPVTAPTTGPEPTRTTGTTTPTTTTPPTTTGTSVNGASWNGSSGLADWADGLPSAAALDVPTLTGVWGSLRLSDGGITTSVPPSVSGLTRWWRTPYGTVAELEELGTTDRPDGQLLVLLRGDGTLTTLVEAQLAGVEVEPGGVRLAYATADTGGGMPNLVHIVALADGKETAQWALRDSVMSLRGWNTAGLIVQDTAGLDVVTDAGRHHHTQTLLPDTAVATESADILVRSDHDANCAVTLDLSTAAAGPDIACNSSRTYLSPDGRHVLVDSARPGNGGTGSQEFRVVDTRAATTGPPLAPDENVPGWAWLDSDTAWATFPLGISTRRASVRCDIANATCERVPIPSTAPDMPACSARQMTVTERNVGSATGLVYLDFVLQNTGTKICLIRGYPRLGLADTTALTDFREFGHYSSIPVPPTRPIVIPVKGFASFSVALPTDPSGDAAGCTRGPAAVLWQTATTPLVLPQTPDMPVAGTCPVIRDSELALNTSGFEAGS